MAAAEGSHLLWAMTDSYGNATTDDHDSWQLAEQVLVDCCNTENGCGGGGTSSPMQCAVNIADLPSTMSHTYTATDTAQCSYTKSQANAYVSSWYQPCSSGDEKCVQSYIGGDSCEEFYAISLKTSIEVIDSFYDYSGGVYSDPACPDDKHNHAVAIVGWGTDEVTKQDYWIIRNSWGKRSVCCGA